MQLYRNLVFDRTFFSWLDEELEPLDDSYYDSLDAEGGEEEEGTIDKEQEEEIEEEEENIINIQFR